MAGVRGIGGVPEPAPDRPVDPRTRKSDEAVVPPVQDGIQISPSAKAAANVANIIEAARGETEIRADRVAAAKERLARGEYKHEDIVARVAEKILPFLPE